MRSIAKRQSAIYDPTRLNLIDRERRDVINSVYWVGAAWEQLGDVNELDLEYWYGSTWKCLDDDDESLTTTPTDHNLTTLPMEAIGAVRTASAKKKNLGRQGAKAVKKIEMEGNMDDRLSPEKATTFRALAARGNFLAQDRVDVSFSTKELCREFAAPANASNRRLKRLARFLIDRSRLVYKYDWL